MAQSEIYTVLSDVDDETNLNLRRHMNRNQATLEAMDDLVPEDVHEIKKNLTPLESNEYG